MTIKLHIFSRLTTKHINPLIFSNYAEGQWVICSLDVPNKP